MTILIVFLAWFCASILTCALWAGISLGLERRRARAAVMACHPAGGRDPHAVDLYRWEREMQR